MPLKFVFDENLRGPLWRAAQRHNAHGVDPLDVVRVGDPPDLPLSTDDRTLLAWAERAGRILVTTDKHTMPRHLSDHLAAGGRSPGVLMLRPERGLHRVLTFLVLVAHAGALEEWQDRIEYVPPDD